MNSMPRSFTALIAGLHILLLTWVVIACAQLLPGAGRYYAIASLLGLSAFTLMWLHYLIGWIHDRWWPETSLRKYMKATSGIVLVMILAHPILMITIFYMLGLGLPPASYAKYAGAEVIFIYAAVIALIGFLLFETRRWLYGKPIWSLIAVLSHLSMILILVHGWRLGLALQGVPMLQALWIIYAVGYALLLVRLVRTDGFKRDLGVLRAHRVLAATAIVALLGTIGIVVYSFVPDQKPAHTTASQTSTPQNSDEATQTKNEDNTSGTTTITANELASQNGRNGANCWVAVDGTVYQIVSDEWVNGQHVRSNLAYCGADMSEAIKQSPHGKSVLADQTVIGAYEP